MNARDGLSNGPGCGKNSKSAQSGLTSQDLMASDQIRMSKKLIDLPEVCNLVCSIVVLGKKER